MIKEIIENRREGYLAHYIIDGKDLNTPYNRIKELGLKDFEEEIIKCEPILRALNYKKVLISTNVVIDDKETIYEVYESEDTLYVIRYRNI